MQTEQTQHLLKRASDIALMQGHPVCISIVDSSGLLCGFLRMDDSIPGAIDIATKKARTAALFRTDTIFIAPEARPGGSIYTLEATNGGLISFGGGLAIHDSSGKVIGGLGISGAPVEVDQAIALQVLGR